MSESRRSLSRALRGAARHPVLEPDPGFVDRLEQRLRSLDINAVPVPTSNVVAFRRRLTRGAAIGVIAGVMTAAGAAAAAIVTVRHLTSPTPATTVRPTTVLTVARLGPTSTIESTSTTVVTVLSAVSTTVADPATASPIITTAPTTAPSFIPATTTTPATTPQPTTTSPDTTTTATTPPSTASPNTTTTTTTTTTSAPPTTAEPTQTTAAVLPATDAPPTTTTTEVHTGATMHLDCTAVASGIQCTWSAVPGGTDHVVVLRSTAAETRGRVLFPAAGASSMTDTTARPGVTYTYLVHAEDAAGTSLAHTNAVTVSCCG